VGHADVEHIEMVPCYIGRSPDLGEVRVEAPFAGRNGERGIRGRRGGIVAWKNEGPLVFVDLTDTVGPRADGEGGPVPEHIVIMGT
jgi:hypothetical protein